MAIRPAKKKRSGGISSPKGMGVHDVQRGAQVLPETAGEHSPPERASNGTRRRASAPHALQGTRSGAGTRTRCSSVRPQLAQAYSKRGMHWLYPYGV
jgi:hypothetical protein